MATLRSALRGLAPAAGFVSKGIRVSPGPRVTARRGIFSHAGGFRMFISERFSLKRPETWFLGIAMAVGGTYRVRVSKEWKDASSSTILKDSDTAWGQKEEEGKAPRNPNI